MTCSTSFGLRTLYDRYLLRHPETRDVIETPQYFFLRIACGIYPRVPDVLDFYRLISSLDYLPSRLPYSMQARAGHSSLPVSF